MRKVLCRCVVVVLTGLCSTASVALGQVMPTDSVLIKALRTDELLPRLLDSAIKYSGLVHRTDHSIELWKENVKMDRRNILNSLSFVSSYNYGTTGDLTIGKDAGAISQFANFRSSRTDRYNVGINLQIPLGNLLNRKSEMRTSELQAKMAEGERDNAILYVKQEVIRLYQEMKLAQRLLITSSEGKQAAKVNYAMAEKDFLNAGGALDQLSRLHDIYIKASVEFENYVSRFQTNLLQLETITNTSISRLLSTPQ